MLFIPLMCPCNPHILHNKGNTELDNCNKKQRMLETFVTYLHGREHHVRSLILFDSLLNKHRFERELPDDNLQHGMVETLSYHLARPKIKKHKHKTDFL